MVVVCASGRHALVRFVIVAVPCSVTAGSGVRSSTAHTPVAVVVEVRVI